MIRVLKSQTKPPSLQKVNPTKYDEEDVRQMLIDDQNCKCYLCEQYTGKSFHVEHLRPKAEGCFPKLKNEWTNLFLACPYCNERKRELFEKIIEPHTNNIEDLIEQRFNFKNSQFEFQFNENNEGIEQTVSLLEKLLNGKNGVRDTKCNLLVHDIELSINTFQKIVIAFLNNPVQSNRQAVIDCINIEKEFLGLKYWILKDHPTLFSEFKKFVVWNKTQS